MQTKVEPGMPSRVNLVVVIMIKVAMVAVLINIIIIGHYLCLMFTLKKDA